MRTKEWVELGSDITPVIWRRDRSDGRMVDEKERTPPIQKTEMVAEWNAEDS
jgi:hypothetical protein